ncbi:MAG TPA: PilZ domain-containing protein [Clostridia bacterium]|nr:PilZ domain-containing protein [Clostridia bacterium]
MNVTCAMPTPTMSAVSIGERRTSPRYKFFGEVQILAESLSARKAQVKDISLEGCFVETTEPMPRNGQVLLRFLMGGSEFEMQGLVCRSEPGLGMGIRFNS